MSFRSEIEFLASERDDSRVKRIVKGFSNERWENVGYAHITTFYHAKMNGFGSFWNIDADDTFICLSPERTMELLLMVERKAAEEKVSLFSLDMWYSKSCVNHWTFGISYADNSVDWLGMMEKHISEKNEYASNPPNMDGYFTYLRSHAEYRIESFYVENMRFLHYSNDFFRRPWASGFYHWKGGKLEFPLLMDCFGIQNLGVVAVPNEVSKIDLRVSDEEARLAMVRNCYPADRSDLEIRMQ